MNKKGISNVITTLIIVGIGLTVVGVAWLVINNLIVKTSENIETSHSKVSNLMSKGVPTSCKDILNMGYGNENGTYTIYSGTDEIEVYCDMTTEGGGWTLIASYIDGSFFNNCTDIGMAHGESCASCCIEFTDDGKPCDTEEEKAIQDSEIERLKQKMIITKAQGSLENYESEDFVSPAYYLVSFKESMMYDDDDDYITYDFSEYYTKSMKDFYENENTNHLELRIPEKSSSLESSINNCSTLELAIMMADNDGGPVNYYNNPSRRYSNWSFARTGPGWNAGNNGGCHYDDNIGFWGNKKLGGQYNQVSDYILWYVR